jgi:ABC-type transport system substrate-binding protein
MKLGERKVLKRKISGLTLIVLVSVSLLSVMVVPSSAQPRIVGVAKGDQFKYGEFCSHWNSNDPEATPPSAINVYNETEWFSMSIENVSGTIVNVHFTYHFKNQTETPSDAYVNIDTGEGNAIVWIVSADLEENDSLYTTGYLANWKINETIVRTYPYGNRDTNHINITMEQLGEGYHSWMRANYYWDKSTGVLVEFSAEATLQTGEYLTTYSISFRIIESSVWVVSNRGPRMDSLYIKYYNSSNDVYDALKNGEVDLTDAGLNQAQMEEVFNDPNIQAAISPTGIREFDFNNNDTTPTYRNYKNPTAYKEFRQGIACLVDKDYIVDNLCNYSYRIDTPISRPVNDWWVDWSVSQYDSYGDLLGNYPYEYNLELAAHYFDLSGFVQGNTTNPYYNGEISGSARYLRINPATGEDMAPLIFYIRNDDPPRLEAGRILRDNLRMMGIPVNATEANFSTCRTKVMNERDYHIYTGGWSSGTLSVLSLYSSEYIYLGGANYPQFRNATYDYWVEKALFPSDLDLAKEAALACQKILIEQATCVWLYTPSQVMGYRNIYGVVNARGGSIDNQWTFLKALDDSKTEICYGLRSPPSSLNVITNYLLGYSQDDCLNLMYDTLLSYCPYDKTPGNVYEEGDRGGSMPWLAKDWELGRWESPYNSSESLTKLTFYLREGIKWHDGVELTSSDVKFTIEYIKNLGSLSSLYYLVSDVHHVTTPNPYTVVVYENVSNIWTLDYIGTLPILPKHVFQNIHDVTGYTPGANEGHPASETLIGSGPWKYVNYTSSRLCLEANRDYFMETPPKEEIDFRYDWEMGCWVVDAMDATMVCEAFDTSGNGVPSAKWEPGCDIAKGDCKVNAFDLVTVIQKFNTTWGKSARRGIVQPPTECAIYVEPLHDPIVVGENLTVYVKLKNLAMLSGIQFKLNYDNSKLNCLDLNLNEIFGEYTQETKKEINQTRGFLWASISSLAGAQLVNGNTTLATITFKATKPSGSMLDLWGTKLASYGAPGSTCQLMAHMVIDQGVMVGVITSTGTNVKVAPAENAKVTFASITAPGVTTLNVTQPPSTEFTSVLCQEIKTTATYSGQITVQFSYDPTGLSLEDEESMKIWLWDATAKAWVDITSYVDTEKNIIYGVAPHLSMFGVTSDLGLEGAMSSQGEITVSTPSSPPSGLEARNLMVLKYYEITTTKTYYPPITIRIAYDSTVMAPEQESFVQIWLWNQTLGAWVDITSHVDTINNIVYGVTSHLSMFGVTSLPPPPKDIAIINPTCSKTSIPLGGNVTVNFIVMNQKDFTQSLNVTIYCNSTAVVTYPLTLGRQAQMVISYTWSTTKWKKGRYAISACGHVLSQVAVTIVGDVDGDFKVTILDVVKITSIYAVKRGDPRFNPNSDIDDDGVITILDVVKCTSHYAQKDP